MPESEQITISTVNQFRVDTFRLVKLDAELLFPLQAATQPRRHHPVIYVSASEPVCRLFMPLQRTGDLHRSV